MVIGVRVDAAVEQRLDALALHLGKSRSACIREAIEQDLLRHGYDNEARRQSEHFARLEQPHWGEQIPRWSARTA